MNHQITTKTTGDEWEQVMTCGLANATIAELVWQDTAIGYRNHKECLLDDGKPKAELQREGNTITVICKRQEHFARCWGTNPDANKDALEALAKDWQEQEQAWLPIMRYFEAGSKEYNTFFHEWASQRDEELDDLEHQIESEQLKREGDIKFCESQITALLDRLEALDQHRQDDYDRAMELFKERGLRLDAHEKLYQGLHNLFSLHRERLFHFMDRKRDE